jgi:pyridoxamine 5'-phosphate oxidase
VIQDPLDRFCQLLERAQRIQEGDARAVCLATADGEGSPSARMVVLSGVERDGFIFYSNYESRKARDLDQNPRAALCFHWPALAVQVRVEGVVEKVSWEESDAYFATRPRGHQLAAYTSRQSTPLESRRELQQRFREAEARFGGQGQSIPRPPSWGGYRLRPESIEFWHGFENRLHDRLLYTRGPGDWLFERLSP